MSLRLWQSALFTRRKSIIDTDSSGRTSRLQSCRRGRRDSAAARAANAQTCPVCALARVSRYGPPFLRVLAAVVSREWLGWMPSFGLPSLMALPGTITFKPGFGKRGAGATPVPTSAASGWLPGMQELTGVYTYACRDVAYGDFYYLFRYQAFWMRPAAMLLLHAFGSLLIKMLLMHAYAALFMLLAQDNCREAFRAEVTRRLDRLRRRIWPRPPVRLIPVEPGDLCAFCHEDLLPEADPDDKAAVAAAAVQERLHCRWGCGKAVHKACAASWGRNSCVYCNAPML
mmetsp:Transcript_29704/g.62488  ORF Transcript_29704/g.62488 Transcript_29704/m.62488 type:complete len:286 (-) Transcript_29704:1074-1931(-)